MGGHYDAGPSGYSGRLYCNLAQEFGDHLYERMEVPAIEEQKRAPAHLTPTEARASGLAGEKILSMFTTAQSYAQPFGGLKVAGQHGWFAARPSGTEGVSISTLKRFSAENTAGRFRRRQIIDHLFTGAGTAHATNKNSFEE